MTKTINVIKKDLNEAKFQRREKKLVGRITSRIKLITKNGKPLN